MHNDPFIYDEALEIWARLVAGGVHSLDASSACTLIDGVPNRADAGGSYKGVTDPNEPLRFQVTRARWDTMA